MKIESEKIFFDGVASERRSVSARKKIGKMLVNLLQNHHVNTPLLNTIEVDTGIVAESKKFGISNYSLHKYLGKRIFPWSDGKKSIILGEKQMKDIEAVLNLYYYWKNSDSTMGSKQMIENVFFHLFM